jgi:hypothetical protein
VVLGGVCLARKKIALDVVSTRPITVPVIESPSMPLDVNDGTTRTNQRYTSSAMTERWSTYADALVHEAILIREYLPTYNLDGVIR